MSFYRTFLTAVAAMGLATSVFATDATTTATPAQATPEAAATATQASTTPAAEQTKINVNTATAQELKKIKGISNAKAKAIVHYRTKHGDFKAVEDLKEVTGFKKMTEKKLKEIEAQLTIG